MGMLIESNLPCEDCGSSDAKAEYESNFFCFSCEKSSKKPISQTNPYLKDPKMREKLARRSVVTSSGVEGIEYTPAPRYKRSPGTKQAWGILKKCHITSDLIKKYDIHFTNNLEIWSKKKLDYWGTGARIILPYPGGYEAKAIRKGDKFKYITHGPKDTLFRSRNCVEDSKVVVIVEDILSAIRVGEHLPTVSLLGTNVQNNHIKELTTISKNFIIWMDGDRQGRKAAKQLKDRLEWCRFDVRIIYTELDPKRHTDEEINWILNS